MAQLDDLKAFTEIAQQGSFTKAAESMNCSRSHLSKQLNQLESSLGVRLITRTTRAQRLTEQGDKLYNQCQIAFNSLTNAVEKTMEQAEQLQGNININCVGGYLGEEIIGNLVGEFLQQYPDISITLDFSSDRVDLLTQEFDIVFRMGALQDSGLIARQLININNGLFASPNYLKEYGTPKDPKDLCNHRCITGSVNQWSFQSQTSKAKSSKRKSQDVNVSGNIRCKNGRVMKNLALSHNGIARLPYYYCQKELNSKLLVSVFETSASEQWKLADTPLYLVYQKDNLQPQRLNVFIQYAIKYFQQHTLFNSYK